MRREKQNAQRVLLKKLAESSSAQQDVRQKIEDGLKAQEGSNELLQGSNETLLDKVDQVVNAQQDLNQGLDNVLKNQEGSNETLLDKIDQIGVQNKADNILFINQGLGHHEQVMDSQQSIHNEVLKGIEQQENCCFEVQSGFDSVKDQIESKANLFDLASKALFGIDWTSSNVS